MRAFIFLGIFLVSAVFGTLLGVSLRKKLTKTLEKRDLADSREEKSALEIFQDEGLITEFRQAEAFYQPETDPLEDEERVPLEEAEDIADPDELLRALRSLPEEVREQILAEAGFPAAEEGSEEDNE